MLYFPGSKFWNTYFPADVISTLTVLAKPLCPAAIITVPSAGNPDEVNAYPFTAPKPLLYHGNGLKIDPIVALGDEILTRRKPKTRMVEVIATPMVMVFLCIFNKFRIWYCSCCNTS